MKAKFETKSRSVKQPCYSCSKSTKVTEKSSKGTELTVTETKHKRHQSTEKTRRTLTEMPKWVPRTIKRDMAVDFFQENNPKKTSFSSGLELRREASVRHRAQRSLLLTKKLRAFSFNESYLQQRNSNKVQESPAKKEFGMELVFSSGKFTNSYSSLSSEISEDDIQSQTSEELQNEAEILLRIVKNNFEGGEIEVKEESLVKSKLLQILYLREERTFIDIKKILGADALTGEPLMRFCYLLVCENLDIY